MAQFAMNNRNGKVKRPLVSIRDFSTITEPNSDLLVDLLNAIEVDGKVLIILENDQAENANVIKAAEELSEVSVVLISELSSEDFRNADYLVVTEGAIKQVSERLS